MVPSKALDCQSVKRICAHPGTVVMCRDAAAPAGGGMTRAGMSGAATGMGVTGLEQVSNISVRRPVSQKYSLLSGRASVGCISGVHAELKHRSVEGSGADQSPEVMCAGVVGQGGATPPSRIAVSVLSLHSVASHYPISHTSVVAYAQELSGMEK
jgi:hypothetical protein